MSIKVAVLGANGFIGSRTVEWLHLGGHAQVRPIVRSINSLARLSRFNLDCRVADARNRQALQNAFAGCDAVIHTVAGDPATIVGAISPAYQAAQDAGVKRIVYLSTASVHGQTPEPGTNENTPLKANQPLAYNNAKVHAEQRLWQLRKTGSVEVVVLRPGIVTGPRSFWTSNFCTSLLAGTAYMIDSGRGICNSLYVDNLVSGIYLAMTTPAADGQAFILGDAETVTWADLYRPFATALGFELNSLPDLTYQSRSRSWLEQIEALNNIPAIRSLVQRIPKPMRRALYLALTSSTADSPWTHPALAPSIPAPESTLEMAMLYQCKYKLPSEKARQILGYEPIVSFSEGCQRTLGWLEFSGFPVQVTRHNS